MPAVENPRISLDVKEKEFLSFKEAAEILGVTKRTIQTYVGCGWIPVITITRRTKRIRRNDLIRFMEQASASELPPPNPRSSAQMAMPF